MRDALGQITKQKYNVFKREHLFSKSLLTKATFLVFQYISRCLFKFLPSILLRSVFSRSGLSCASRLRSSLVQMMKAFKGLLTLCCVDKDFTSGLAQLESEFTDSGLEGPELGERSSIISSRSTEPESALLNMARFAQSWKAAGSWLKCMLMLRMVMMFWLSAVILLVMQRGPIYVGAPPIGGQEEWI